MVSILEQSDRVEHILLNQEKFVLEGKSRLIGVERFMDKEFALHYPLCRIADLMLWRQLNTDFSKPTIHLIVAFHPSETSRLTDELLETIAQMFMIGLGFMDSPYLVYRRQEHDSLHIHVITVGFDINGKTVKQSFMRSKCNLIRMAIENEYRLIHASGRRARKPRLKSQQP